MSSINDLLELLENAEELDQLATARHLYEMIMMEDEADENHAATLMYVANLVDLGDLNHAEATLLRIEDEIPEDLSATFLSQRGDLQSYRGNYAEAEKDYREANKIDSNQGEYLVFAAQAAFQQGEVARAEYLIREAIAIGGEVLDEAYGNLAGYLVAQQRYQEAQACYEKVVSLNSDNDFAQEWIEDLNRVLKLQAQSAARP